MVGLHLLKVVSWIIRACFREALRQRLRSDSVPVDPTLASAGTSQLQEVTYRVTGYLDAAREFVIECLAKKGLAD